MDVAIRDQQVSFLDGEVSEKQVKWAIAILLIIGALALLLLWDRKIEMWENRDRQQAYKLLSVSSSEPGLKGRGGEVFFYVIRIPGNKFDLIRDRYMSDHPEDLVWSEGNKHRPSDRSHRILTRHSTLELDTNYFRVNGKDIQLVI